MKTPSATPTGSVQPFEVNETFFSTTDGRGVITAGNAVFARTSAYSLSQLLGANHNLIRHPDMPRAVFRALWRNAQAGRLFMGYVKNLAANGNHYWVFAVIVPLSDGFLSVRIKPTTARLEQVEGLYAQLLQLEEEAIAAGASEGQATDRALAGLSERMVALGAVDYDAFSHDCLIAEIKHRDTAVAQRRLQLFSAKLPAPADESLVALHAEGLVTYARLNDVFHTLELFLADGADIVRRKDTVQAMADTFRLNALNAHLAAHPLGSTGVVIGTVASFLGTNAGVLEDNMIKLTGTIGQTSGAVSQIASNLAAARIQLEMLLNFIEEMIAHPSELERYLAMILQLRAALTRTLEAAMAGFAVLEDQLPVLRTEQERLHQDIVALQAAQVTGLTEAARLPQAAELRSMFLDLRRQIEAAGLQMSGLGGVVGHLILLMQSTPQKVAALERSLQALSASSVPTSGTGGSIAAGPPVPVADPVAGRDRVGPSFR